MRPVFLPRGGTRAVFFWPSALLGAKRFALGMFPVLVM